MIFPSHNMQPCLVSWGEDRGIAHHWQDFYHGNYQELLTISVAKLIMWCQPSQLIHIIYPQPAAACYEDSLLCKGLMYVCVLRSDVMFGPVDELLLKWMFHRECFFRRGTLDWKGYTSNSQYSGTGLWEGETESQQHRGAAGKHNVRSQRRLCKVRPRNGWNP